MLTVDEDLIYNVEPVARFNPRRLDSLRPEMRPLVGAVVTWQSAGTGADDEPYPGQQRWMTTDPRLEGLWVPAEDLEPVDIASSVFECGESIMAQDGGGYDRR